LPTRHSKAFHQLVGHTRRQPVAQSWGSINFRIQNPIDFRFRQPLSSQDVDELGPSEAAGGAFDDNNNTRTRGTDFPKNPGFGPAVHATHMEKISAGSWPAPRRVSRAKPASLIEGYTGVVNAASQLT
jgi:hypothetical protein